MPTGRVYAVDLCCGVGGLSFGLRKAGIRVIAGIDVDKTCQFPFEWNNKARFIPDDITDISVDKVAKLYPKGGIRLLAGCPPCRPFSPFRRRMQNWSHKEWGLITEFARLTKALKPELLTLENVPGLASKRIFHQFVKSLKQLGYDVDYKSVYCPRFGIPQHRRRLVLLASLLGPVKVPAGNLPPTRFRTVRDALRSVRKIRAGQKDSKDPLHVARSVTDLNLRRLRSSRPGGTWKDWPKPLRAKCHRKKTGASYQSVYARMSWDEPAPTITTQAYNFGTGRFGHPDQDRSISLREAALLQTFPRSFKFVEPGGRVRFNRVGQHIGNAVPPRLALSIGKEILRLARQAHIRRQSR